MHCLIGVTQVDECLSKVILKLDCLFIGLYCFLKIFLLLVDYAKIVVCLGIIWIYCKRVFVRLFGLLMLLVHVICVAQEYKRFFIGPVGLHGLPVHFYGFLIIPPVVVIYSFFKKIILFCRGTGHFPS